MKVALYARVSTKDHDQDPETQLVALRSELTTRDWESYKEYVDEASARDLRRRTAWRDLLADAGRRKFKSIVVLRLDRAFRSVKDMHDVLTELDAYRVELVTVREGLDTTTAQGRFMRNILASFAELEGELIRERVKDGHARARAQGIKLGRPLSLTREQRDALRSIYPQLKAGTISQSQAERIVGISRRTVGRFIVEHEEKLRQDGTLFEGATSH